MVVGLLVLLAFAVGSIPFGLVIGRIFFRTDIRTHGSGNIGAMNALRSLGKGGAIAVLLLDLAKGALPVLGAAHFGMRDFPLAFIAGAAVLGHCFSPWLGFHGGKGVATSFGAVLALSPPAGAICILGWALGALVITPYSSVGSILSMLLAPPALWLMTHSLAEALFGLVAAALILYTHRENIERLRNGTENPIPFLKGRSRRGG